MSLVIGEKRIFSNNFTSTPKSFLADNFHCEENDKLQLSNGANSLKNLPVDLSSSNIYEDKGGFQFDLSFDETFSKNVNAKGYYSSKERNLSLRLKFFLEKILYENGQEKKQKFEIEFSINYSGLEINSAERKIEKEDIYKFLNRIMKDLVKVLNDDEKNIAGIIFDKEDLHDLLQIGDKEVGKFLNEIILLIQTLAKIKKLNNPGAENLLFSPKRNRSEIIETNQTKQSSIQIEMSVNKIDT